MEDRTPRLSGALLLVLLRERWVASLRHGTHL